MVPSWLVEELRTVPTYERFAGADELEDGLRRIAASAPQAARLRRVGTSRLGSPITCLTVGEGPADALVIGVPHPNEPVGGLTALHLAERLCSAAALRDRLGYRWHIVACIDPDGLRLNEGWLAGPFTRQHYLRHFYRPAGDEQVEWTFPLDHKQAYFDAVLPETLAMMRLIDSTRPALLCSLHNSEQGGAYYYLSRPEAALLPILQALPAAFDVPLDRGEPESALSTAYADGIFSSPGLPEIYDDAEAAGDPLPLGAGNNSASYAGRYGTLTVVSEVPYWADPRAGDTEPTDTGYASALRGQAEALDELGGLINGVLADVGPVLSCDSPFLRATRFFGRLLAERPGPIRRRAAQPSAARAATVAELASIDDVVHGYRLRYGGMLVRLLEAEIAIGNVRPAVRAARERMADRRRAWEALADSVNEAERVPIRSLVSIQYGAMLAAAAELAGQA